VGLIKMFGGIWPTALSLPTPKSAYILLITQNKILTSTNIKEKKIQKLGKACFLDFRLNFEIGRHVFDASS
jgi:hypothetical protein